MANEEDKILFGAEFEGEDIVKGVDEVLNSLAKAQEAQALLKIALNETTTAMKANRKEAEALAKAKPLDPKLIQEQVDKLAALNKQYDDLVSGQADLQVAQKKTTDVVKQFNKASAEQVKSNNEIGKAVKKFTSINAIAADGIKKVGNNVKDLAFGLITGFAGGMVATVIPTLIEFIATTAEANNVINKMKKDKETLNEVFTSAAKSVGDDVAKLQVYKDKLNDVNIPAADRVRIAKEYNKIADETNKIDITQIDNLKLINEQIEKQNKLIIQRAISTAALSKLTEASTALVDAQLKLSQELRSASLTEEDVVKTMNAITNDQINARQLQQQSLDGYTKNLQVNSDKQAKIQKNNSAAITKEIREISSLVRTRDAAQKELNELGALLSPLITPDGLSSRDTTKGQTDKVIENVFQQKLAELRARLAAASASAFQSEGLIREKFALQLDKEFFEISKLLREKKLTVPQADILRGLLRQINSVDLDKGLEEFRKKRQEAFNKITDILTQAQTEAATKRVANLRDEFAKEQLAIDQNYEQSIQAINRRQEDLLKSIDTDTKAGLISPEIARRKKLIAAFIYGDLLDQAEQAKRNQQLDLAFKQFQRTLDNLRSGFEDEQLNQTESTTRLIREQTGLFLEGKIGYEKYQKNLTRILKEESTQRRKDVLSESELELDQINKRIAATTDPAQLKQLKAQRDALRAEIAKLRREIATGTADDTNTAAKDRLQNFIDYANAINGLAQSVASFWNQVNQTEAQALDRSIALQNKRVENAREIAENGNAEYLEMEQKRLDELEQKRANNARKQIAINNALVASQAIVAAISAIAQATQSGSPLAAIAAVGAVIAAIGAAYSFVNSLQPQEPGFYEGEEYVSGRGVKPGKDQVRARLHVGERVVTAEDNQKYWDTLSAIHNHKIPADALNDFVANYPHHNIPTVDFDRLSSATDGKIGADSYELLNKVDRLNGTMEQVVVGLGEIGVNVNMDEHGLEVGISRARRRRILRSKS